MNILKKVFLINKKTENKKGLNQDAFDPSKEIPISKHNIIGYEDKLYVLSICNNHDTWVEIIKIKKP